MILENIAFLRDVSIGTMLKEIDSQKDTASVQKLGGPRQILSTSADSNSLLSGPKRKAWIKC